jgi:hypothetical protein
VIVVFHDMHKIWQRGSNILIMSQCGGCRLLATLRDPNTGKTYMVGYANPVQYISGLDIGLEYVYADNPRLKPCTSQYRGPKFHG